MNNKIDIIPFNNKGQCHGYWETYFEGNLWYKCFYNNGKKVGYEEIHYTDLKIETNGKLSKKRYKI